MTDSSIAIATYFIVLSVLLMLSGFVSTKFNYGTTEKDGITIACIVWPLTLFVLPVGAALISAYKFGSWLAKYNQGDKS